MTPPNRLKELGLIPSADEESYNHLVSLAANLCGTPIAVICTLEDSGLKYKAKVGLSEQELTPNQNFFSTIMESKSWLIVEDSFQDTRFDKSSSDSSSFTVRFFAGTPLVLQSGHCLGAVAIMDTKPRTCGANQKQFLETLARHTIALIENRTDGLLEAALKIIEDQRVKLQEASRLSVLGELASEVAHEINNPLEVIVARAGRLLQHATQQTSFSQEVVAANAKGIEDTAIKIAEISRSILSVARGANEQPRETIPLSKIYEIVLELAQERLKQNQIELKITPPPSSLLVTCNPTQVSQALLNLLFNAIDAVDTLPIRWIHIDGTLSSGWIELTVTDSGMGIPPAVQPHLMKPFHTTKARGRGTGLGLAISEKILKAHGGSLHYDSNSKHTRFIARLPI